MNSRLNIFYFAPHQDDELSNLGVDICREITRDNEVYVVLCTDGSASSVKRMLCNRGSCRWHPGEHCYELNEAEFIAARDREFVLSCKALGIKDENIIISPIRAKDGRLTMNQAKEIMLRAIRDSDINRCVIKTIAPTPEKGQNPDHTAVGEAAKELYNEARVPDIGLIYEFILFPEGTNRDGFEILVPTEEEKEKIKKAASQYRLWDPKNRRYAVGYHSVADEFDSFLENAEALISRKNSSLT